MERKIKRIHFKTGGEFFGVSSENSNNLGGATVNSNQQTNVQQTVNKQPNPLINNLLNELKMLTDLYNKVMANMKTKLTTESYLSFENGNVVSGNKNVQTKNENITRVINETANNFNAKLKEIDKNLLAVNKFNPDILTNEILTNLTNKIKSIKGELTNINNNINAIPKQKAYSKDDKNLIHQISSRIKNVEESLLKDPAIKQIKSMSVSENLVKDVSGNGNPMQVAMKITNDLISKFIDTTVSRINTETQNTFPNEDKVFIIVNEEYKKAKEALKKASAVHDSYREDKNIPMKHGDYFHYLINFDINRAVSNNLISVGWTRLDDFYKKYYDFFLTEKSADRNNLKANAMLLLNQVVNKTK